ncbi:protein FAM32A-like [Bos javanicus]|uniref:protein FAM32A-like n=1 Tax=Bos javanicus TaxID=9906 RepID=UPI002AA802B9|nr:protein FAM32A-like [Bos javanicus]
MFIAVNPYRGNLLDLQRRTIFSQFPFEKLTPHSCPFRNLNPKMGSMDAYEQVQKGPLKLKGVTELGVTRRKKKKDRDKAKLLETMGKIQKNQEEDLRRHLDPAQVAFEKVQEKRQMERILKKASKSHKQRVEDFNRHLDMLTEHYDIPKVSWTK